MMITDPQQVELCKRAEVFEQLLEHPAWQEYVTLCGRQRDRWLSECATKDDRIFYSGMCHAINVATVIPKAVIEARDNLMAELERQEQAGKNGNNENVIEFPGRMRPPPQTV